MCRNMSENISLFILKVVYILKLQALANRKHSWIGCIILVVIKWVVKNANFNAKQKISFLCKSGIQREVSEKI